MPYESPARVQTRRSAAALAAVNGSLVGVDEHSQPPQLPSGQHGALVAQRQLGSIGAGRSGRGYSPYARRIQTRAAQYDRATEQQDDDHQEDQEDAAASPLPSPTRQQSTGLFGKVRSLPGRMLGLLSRSSSRQSALSSSTSLADVRAELDHQLRKEQQGVLPRSRTSTQLANSAGSRAGERRANPVPPLPASSSMSALSSFAPRTNHSTLNLQTSQPPFLRGASPASGGARNRSPSPLRNGLAGSMSAFQLAQQHPTTLGDGATANPFGLQSRSPFVDSPRRHHHTASSSYASQSLHQHQKGHPLFPYSSNLPRGTSPSLSGSFSMRDGLSTLGGGAGSATGKRTFASRTMTTAAAASPLGREYATSHRNLPASRTISGGLSSLAAAAADEGEDVEMLATTTSSTTVADAAAAGATDRARKRQLVWDPECGLVSRETLEQEKAKDAPPMPKNEAERILEVLEGMGRTPLGEAKRASTRPKHINIPLLAAAEEDKRLTRSSTTHAFLFASTPYAARAAKPLPSPTSSAAAAKPEKGLQAVLRAREERRRQLLEQERAERERERLEDEERERQRDKRRRDRRRRIEELMSDDDHERDVFSAEEEQDDRITSPRRVTRSSARAQTPGKSPRATSTRTSASTKTKGKGKEFLGPPQQVDRTESERPSPSRRSTRASSRTSQQPKLPSPAPVRKTRGSKKQTRDEVDQVEEEEDAEMDAEQEEEEEEQRPAKRTAAAVSSRAKSPAAKSPSPAEASSAAEQPAAAAPKITFPAPSSFPTTAPSTSTGRSSLRPGKSHTSRQHTTSSRVFSAKEEDLPPIDDAALAKIQMPAFKVPAGFSFGPLPSSAAASVGAATTAASTASTSTAADSISTEITPAAPTTSLLSRLGAAPPSTSAAETTKPAAAAAFSFGAPPAPAPANKPAPTTFSFGAPPATNAATEKKEPTTAATSKTAPPDFFASKPTAPASSGADANGSGKPNFFGAIIAGDADKSKAAGADTTSNKSTPSFTFGAPTTKSSTDSVIKPTEVIPPTPAAAEAPKPAPVAAASGNPFAAFGKPVAELVKEAEGGKEAAPTKPASPFSFGATPTTTDAPEKAEPLKSPFAFGTTAAAAKSDAAPTTASPFSFGAPASKASDDKDKPAPFSFGAAAKPPTTTTPTFTFGTTPATPQAEEKKDSAPKPTFGTLNPPSAPASVTDEAGDSGMEDEAEPAAAPAPFSFGGVSSGGSTAPATGASLFGSTAPSSAGFTFGAPTSTEKKDTNPPASPFGAPSPAAATNSFFGGATTSPSKPPAFTFGAPSASPSPAPTSPAPGSGAVTPSFSFGAGAPAAGGASPFNFGGNSSSAAAPATASVAPTFTFGAATPSAPVSPAPATATNFAFGNPTSSAMGQTLSTTSTTGSVNGGGGFTFGAASAAAPTSSAAGFAFGAPAAAAASPFAFGAPAATNGSQPGTPGAVTPGGTTGGFNFGAPAATTTGSAPPTPGGGGLFNIGSGGGGDDSNKGRPIRPLRRTKR